MLHIIFLILKIIGCILLAILGLIVLLLCVIFFVAVKYEGRGSCTRTLQSLDADLRFHWFFHLIRGWVCYQDEHLSYQLKFAWKTVATSDMTSEAGLREESSEVSETSVSPPEKAQEVIEDDLKEIEEVIETEPEDVQEKDQKKDQKKDLTEDQKEHKKVEAEVPTISERISRVFRKIKYTFQIIYDKIKKLIATKEKFVDFVSDEIHQNAWGRLIKELKRILRRLNPKRLELKLHFGFDDPSVTGKILAFCGMFYPVTAHHVQLEPDFTEQVIEGEGFVKGRIRVIYFVSTALHMLLDKNVRMTYKDFKSLH